MVNYCCVYGCGRNSRLNKHLNYYGLPKERHRQIEWLKAAGREDLLKKREDKVAVSYRFCSRHFSPSSIKNRHLSSDAVPTLCLPGSLTEEESDSEPALHNDIVCDNCSNPIIGFRYKCVNCDDYDLCQKCEMLEAHSDHYMLRIPKPLKFKLCDNLIKKWRKFFISNHIIPSREDIKGNSDISSDDEPINKYVKQYDSGVDLSEDIKLKIRKEVTRVLNVQTQDANDKPQVTKKEDTIAKKRPAEVDRSVKKVRTDEIQTIEYNKTEVCNTVVDVSAPELVFADVNEIKDDQVEYVKSEGTDSIMPVVSEPPTMHVKLSDDLSHLMIEMTRNNEKIIYRYSNDVVGNLDISLK